MLNNVHKTSGYHRADKKDDVTSHQVLAAANSWLRGYFSWTQYVDCQTDINTLNAIIHTAIFSKAYHCIFNIVDWTAEQITHKTETTGEMKVSEFKDFYGK